MLGIDPGLSRCGYGCVANDPAGPRAVAAGVLTTPVDDPLPARLGALATDLDQLLEELDPAVVVVERVFFQSAVRNAMAVGQASGLALAAASQRGCTVAQYSSNEVKVAVTGYGAATKAQMQRMVQTILGLAEPPRPPDAADALALAICHLASTRAERLATGAPR